MCGRPRCLQVRALVQALGRSSLVRACTNILVGLRPVLSAPATPESTSYCWLLPLVANIVTGARSACYSACVAVSVAGAVAAPSCGALAHLRRRLSILLHACAYAPHACTAAALAGPMKDLSSA